MNKKEVKNILISMRTPENEAAINYLLGEIDMRDESAIQKAAQDLGNSETNIREFFAKRIEEQRFHQNDTQYPINEMFTYGISGNCIHLHLPVDLHDSIEKNGFSKTMDIVNLQLLDAIEKIKKMRDDRFYQFQGKDSIYMISPAMLKREMQFLETLDFTTHLYNKKQLNDESFIKATPEARLAIHIFGKNQNVGTASIKFDTIDSKEWQEKKDKVVKSFKQKD